MWRSCKVLPALTSCESIVKVNVWVKLVQNHHSCFTKLALAYQQLQCLNQNQNVALKCAESHSLAFGLSGLVASSPFVPGPGMMACYHGWQPSCAQQHQGQGPSRSPRYIAAPAEASASISRATNLPSHVPSPDLFWFQGPFRAFLVICCSQPGREGSVGAPWVARGLLAVPSCLWLPLRWQRVCFLNHHTKLLFPVNSMQLLQNWLEREPHLSCLIRRRLWVRRHLAKGNWRCFTGIFIS